MGHLPSRAAGPNIGCVQMPRPVGEQEAYCPGIEISSLHAQGGRCNPLQGYTPFNNMAILSVRETS